MKATMSAKLSTMNSGLVFVGALILSLFLACSTLHTAEIPVTYLDHVVAVGRKDTTFGPNLGKWAGEGTGFFYGRFDHKNSDGTTAYQPCLVTNRHVIEEHIAATNGPLSLRLNPKAGAVGEYDFPLAQNTLPAFSSQQQKFIERAAGVAPSHERGKVTPKLWKVKIAQLR
jgi:hypothetical protein